jgi:hypothetical protein
MAFFGPFGSIGYFQLSGTNIQYSSDGVNASIPQYTDLVSEAFVLPIGSDYWLYATFTDGRTERLNPNDTGTGWLTVTDYEAQKANPAAVLLVPTPQAIGWTEFRGMYYRFNNGILEQDRYDIISNIGNLGAIAGFILEDPATRGMDIYFQTVSGYSRLKLGELGQPISSETEADYLYAKANPAAVLLVPTGPVQTFETTVSLAGNAIVDVLPGVADSDVVVVSQLNGLSTALTAVINAKDAVKASEIAALQAEIDNLPAGLQMSEVQTAINASVAEAVLNEIIDDAQREAIVDAVLAQLSTIDTAVIGRVGVAEAIIATLQTRVAALEAKDVTQDAAIAALEAKDVTQDAAIAAATAAAQSAITSNVAQATRLGNIEQASAVVNQILTPVKVVIVSGAVSSAAGVALSAVSIDNSSATHMTVSIDIGVANAGKDRVDQGFRVMSNGAKEILGHAPSRSGENIYIFTFLKERAGSTTVELILK